MAGFAQRAATRQCDSDRGGESDPTPGFSHLTPAYSNTIAAHCHGQCNTIGDAVTLANAHSNHGR